MVRKVWLVLFLLCIPSVFAVKNYTFSGNYNVYVDSNLTVNDSICLRGVCYTNLTSGGSTSGSSFNQTYADTSLDVAANRSAWFLDTWNTTEEVRVAVNESVFYQIKVAWGNVLDKVILWGDIQNRPTHLSNFTNDLNSSGDNSSWNEARATSLFLNITDQRYNDSGLINTINTSLYSLANGLNNISASYVDNAIQSNLSNLSTYNSTYAFYNGNINSSSWNRTGTTVIQANLADKVALGSNSADSVLKLKVYGYGVNITNATLNSKLCLNGACVTNIIYNDSWINSTIDSKISLINFTGGNNSFNQSLTDNLYISSTYDDLLFGEIVGFTVKTYNGNIVNGSEVGYVAANSICGQEFVGSHFCLEVEVLKTIVNGNHTISGTYWTQKGAPGYTVAANDCIGFTSGVNTYLGAFWDFDATSGGGAGYLTNCANNKSLACCR